MNIYKKLFGAVSTVFVLVSISSLSNAEWILGSGQSVVSCSAISAPPGETEGTPLGDVHMQACINNLSYFPQIDTRPNVTFSNCRVFQYITSHGDTFCTGLMWRDEACAGTQIRAEDGSCVDFEGVNDGGPQQCGKGEGYDGNPINTLTGNKFQREVDFQGVGVFPLSFTRDYSSEKGNWRMPFSGVSYIPEEFLNNYIDSSGVAYEGVVPWQSTNSALGNNSVSDFGAQRPNYFILKDPRALIRLFIKESPNRYADKQGSAYANVMEAADGSFDGLEIVDENNSVLRYNEQGLLIQNLDLSSGVSHDYSYQYNNDNTAELQSVTINRSAGGSLQVNFNPDGTLNNMLTPDQELVTYGYDGEGRLGSVAYPDELSPRLYHYEDLNFPNALTGITDENSVRFATWAYDTQGRAISSEHHNGAEKVVIDYVNIDDSVDSRVLITNELGKQTTYHIENYLGKRKIVSVEGHQSTNCAAANKNYTYFPNGQVETKTDWQGNITSYQYNARNLESSRTEALGTPEERTITTEWHPTFNLRTKITGPGKEIVFTYDAEGRLLSQVSIELPLN